MNSSAPVSTMPCHPRIPGDCGPVAAESETGEAPAKARLTASLWASLHLLHAIRQLPSHHTLGKPVVVHAPAKSRGCLPIDFFRLSHLQV